MRRRSTVWNLVFAIASVVGACARAVAPDDGAVASSDSAVCNLPPPPPPVPTRGGVIEIVDERTGENYAFATFYASLAAIGAQCVQTVDCNCAILDCTRLRPADAGVTLESAGVIAVSSPHTDTLEVAFADGRYSRPVRTMPWVPGDTVSIQARGGSVAPFATSLVFPPRVLGLTVGATMLNAWYEIDRARDLRVAWDPRSGPIEVAIRGGDPPFGISLRCRFDGAEGFGVVPARVLSALTVDPPMLLLQVDAITDRTLTLGDRQVVTRARNAGFTANAVIR